MSDLMIWYWLASRKHTSPGLLSRFMELMQHKIAKLEWNFRVRMKSWKQKSCCHVLQEVYFSILTEM